MSRLLAQLRIRIKVLLIAGLALLGFASIFVALIVTENMRLRGSMAEADTLTEFMQIQTLTKDVASARQDERDYLLQKDQRFAILLDRLGVKIGNDIKQLSEGTGKVDISALNQMQDGYTGYIAAFKDVADSFTKIGTTPDNGLLGNLRKAAHEIETELKTNNDLQLTVSMLMMRRHEKDFIARQDKTYADNLMAEHDHFDQMVKASTAMTPDQQKKLLDLSAAYLAAFKDMSDLQLTTKSKVTAMDTAFKKLEPILFALTQTVSGRYDNSKAAMAQIDTLANKVAIITTLIACASLILLAWLIGQNISRPVQGLAEAMKKLSAGDKTATVAVTGRDEIADMATAFGVFRENMLRAEELTAQELQSQQQQASRAQMIRSLTASFDDDVSAVLQHVATAAEQMQDTANSMANTADETSNQSSVVAGASEKASMNVQTVAVATEELSASVSEIGRQVAQSAEIASRAVSDANRTNDQVKGLAEAAMKIGEVVNLINEIASQTNLLALNATIEAARAGEMGKGFAVVASEVKNLATQTAKATEEIGQQITGIQSATNEAVGAIQQISQTIGEINDITTAIAAAVEEQGAATQEIARNVQQAAVGTQEVSTNIASVSQAASMTGAAAEQVKVTASQLTEQSGSLRSKVEAFLASIKAA